MNTEITVGELRRILCTAADDLTLSQALESKVVLDRRTVARAVRSFNPDQLASA